MSNTLPSVIDSETSVRKSTIPSLVDGETGLDERETYFLDILFDECSGDFKTAMTNAGYPKDYPSAVLRKKLSREIKERTRDYLTSNAVKAANTLVNVMHEPNLPGISNALKAAESILDRAGVVKDEVKAVPLENIMILLPAKKEDDFKVIEHED